MTPAIRQMLSRYSCKTGQDYVNALKEIIQEIALLGLWRAKFFEHAAFYGGTALRILYELDRFSEDIDFSLLKANASFKFQPYMRAVKDELEALGFDVAIEERKKNVETAIESAFIKADTRKHLIKIQTPENISDRIPKTALLTVKLEVDTKPPGDFQTEVKTLLLPIPFSVNTFQLPDLFAGKIHAILMRNWKSRVKGRDYYDFVWYLARQVPVRLKHLEARLRQSSGWVQKEALNQEMLQTLLKEKFNSLDIAAAKRDVEPFLKDKAALTLWSREFFTDLLERLKVV